MSRLLEDLCWLVIEGAPPADDVAAALPWALAAEGEGPRRLALALTLHEGTPEGLNESQTAIFTRGAFTFVVKPGGLSALADVSWEQALSSRFGVVWSLSSLYFAPSVARYERGAETGRVDELGAAPGEGLLGLTAKLASGETRAVIPGAFERLVGERWAAVFPREGETATFWCRED